MIDDIKYCGTGPFVIPIPHNGGLSLGTAPARVGVVLVSRDPRPDPWAVGFSLQSIR